MSEDPHPEQIIDVEVDNQLLLNIEGLQKILLRDEIKNLNAVVVSIASAYRQGKSFILNFFLRFLKGTCKEKKDAKKWLDSAGGPLTGFKWTASPKRETIGIMMWSEVFVLGLPSGEDVAVILLDTQGAFDNETSIEDSAMIFALSTLLSSLQIFNIKDVIKQTDLLYLKEFVEYGQLFSKNDPDGVPFQDLLFLLRDWSYTIEHSYGADGGENYLNSVLDCSPKDSKEVAFLKKSVKRYFRTTNAFLLPHPGKKVANEGIADLEEIDEDFKNSVEILVSDVLDPSRLPIKEINGCKIKVHQLYRLIEAYFEQFRSGKMPKLQSIYEATAEVQHISAVEESVKVYENLMTSVITAEAASKDKDLFKQHLESKTAASKKFEKIKKMGDQNMKQKYQLKLTKILDEKYSQYVQSNDLKREIEEKENEKEKLMEMCSQNERIVDQLRREFAKKTADFREQQNEWRQEKLKMERRLEYEEKKWHENQITIAKITNDLEQMRISQYGALAIAGGDLILKIIEECRK